MDIQEKSRGTFSYLYEWARPYRNRYVLSVLLAVIEVGFGIVPFVCLGKITAVSYTHLTLPTNSLV